jgi:hypothetical protein
MKATKVNKGVELFTLDISLYLLEHFHFGTRCSCIHNDWLSIVTYEHEGEIFKCREKRLRCVRRKITKNWNWNLQKYFLFSRECQSEKLQLVCRKIWIRISRENFQNSQETEYCWRILGFSHTNWQEKLNYASILPVKQERLK